MVEVEPNHGLKREFFDFFTEVMQVGRLVRASETEKYASFRRPLDYRLSSGKIYLSRMGSVAKVHSGLSSLP